MALPKPTLARLLGALWLLDGLLQLQPAMWTMSMVDQTMVAATAGQPAFFGHVMAVSRLVVASHLVLFNAAVAAVQILLGAALLAGRRPRPFLAASIVWALSVWVFGEGLGGLLTGAALVATGAPGAALLYAVAALLAWPERRGSWTGLRTRSQVSAGAAAAVLGGVWILGAALQLQRFYLAPSGMATAVANQAAGVGQVNTASAWLLSSLVWLSHHLGGQGQPVSLALAALQLVLGLGLLAARERAPWLWASIVLAVVVWWGGQAMGMLPTGMATDPNTSAPLVLIAWAALAARAPTPWGSTLSRSRGQSD